ncbi:uncharacterized protein LOC128230963 [Mya arenaria]|uniref:uncharacterized protein LOC128230963 n=1 Tax=Mya arenaria TaxID=6604 RepID=UPI0022DFA30C|nr:uncharacterized protein LOC128230963 [Mya arenaria]
MERKIKVEKWNEQEDGQLCVENMEKKLRKQGFSCTMYEFSPGTTFPDHTHEISKKDSIVTGQFQFSMYGKTIVMQPGEMIEVPKNTVHNAKVVGNQTVTFFDATK